MTPVSGVKGLIIKPVRCPSGSEALGGGANAVVLCHHWGWGRLSVSPVEHRLAHGIHCHSAISAPGCHHLWRLCRCWLTHAGDAPSYLQSCCLPAVYMAVGVYLVICQNIAAQQNWMLASLKATAWFLRVCGIRCVTLRSGSQNLCCFTRWYSLRQMPMLAVQQQQLPWQLLGAGHTWCAQQC